MEMPHRRLQRNQTRNEKMENIGSIVQMQIRMDLNKKYFYFNVNGLSIAEILETTYDGKRCVSCHFNNNQRFPNF